MESEPEKVDLSILDPLRGDPRRDGARWDRMSARITARALELRRLRQIVSRRGAVTVVLAAAAVFAFWWTTPKPVLRGESDILSWAVRDADPGELLRIGGRDAY
jgi:hypothetical protein